MADEPLLDRLSRGLGQFTERLGRVESAVDSVRILRDNHDVLLDVVLKLANVVDRKGALGPELRGIVDVLLQRASDKPPPVRVEASIEK
jgi:hypothetical protein